MQWGEGGRMRAVRGMRGNEQGRQEEERKG